MEKLRTSLHLRIAWVQAELGNGKRKKLISPYIKPDRKKALIQLLNSFWPFLGIWILMYLWSMFSYWIVLPLICINAFFLVRIFIIQHDCGHQSFFGIKNKRLNNVIGRVCSFFTTMPFSYRARAHHFHHAHSRQLETREIGDIDFATVQEYQKKSWWKKVWYKTFRSPVVLFFFAPIVYFLVSNRYPFLDFKSMKESIRRSQLVNNIALVWLYVLLAYLLWRQRFLIIQMWTVFLFSIIAFWFFYVQHQHEETYNQRKGNRDFLASSLLWSTYYKLPRVFQRLTWNIGLHHIHHLSSAIPNYHLQSCVDEHPVLSKYVTIMNFRQSLSCVNNKLWDEKLQKMIWWKEYRQMYG